MNDVLTEGARLGDFRVERLLGRGGMGVVYLARQLSLERPVALKLMSPALGEDPVLLARFRREALAQAAIDHPHIVPVYEAGEIEGHPYIAMRLIPGTTLKGLISSGELAPERALAILVQVADALESAHRAGLIHRDVKPQNVLLGEHDHAYLADFGLTRFVGSESSGGLTASGQPLGTLDYISPEQVEGKEATPASDVYALAATLYECLTHVVPFRKASPAARMFAHLSEPPPLVSTVKPELPAQLDDLVRRGMAKDPGERPTAATLIDEAASLLRLPGVEVTHPSPPPVTIAAEAAAEPSADTLSGRLRRHPVRGAAALIVSAAPIVATALTLVGGDGGDAEASAYREQIAALCDRVDRERALQPRRDRRLARRIRDARTLADERNALLVEYKRDIGLDNDAIGRLEALTPSDASSPSAHTALVRAWKRNLQRRQRIRTELDEVGSYKDLVAAVRRVDAEAFEADGRTLTSGLRRLGQKECRVRPPPERLVIPLRKPLDVRRAERRAARRRAAAAVESPQAGAPPTTNAPRTGTPAPNVPTPPAPAPDASPAPSAPSDGVEKPAPDAGTPRFRRPDPDASPPSNAPIRG